MAQGEIVRDSSSPILIRTFLITTSFFLIPVVLLGWGLPYSLHSTGQTIPVTNSALQELQLGMVALAIFLGGVASFGSSGVITQAAIDEEGVQLRGKVLYGSGDRFFEWSRLRPSGFVWFTGSIRFHVENHLPVFLTPRVARSIILSPWAPSWDVPREIRRTLKISANFSRGVEKD